MPAAKRDPKSIITPDAFSVAPSLLGTPLARPWRRFWALILDVIVVGLITAFTSGFLIRMLTSGFGVVIGVVIAGLLMRRAVRKRTEDDRPATAFRLVLGCAGLTVLTVTISIVLVVRYVDERGGIEQAVEQAVEEAVEEIVARLDSGTVSIGDSERIAEDPSSDSREDELTVVTELLSEDLPERVTDAFEALRDNNADLEDELRDTQAARDRALESAGFGGWITGKFDDIGFGLGWWTMYFAFLMPLMKGQTPGKRALGIRVVRLDGQRVTWWHAFERAGGYAAGFATGLLGFLQIYWDPNRQATHDKIAGTVVIRDGAPKVEGLWDAPMDGA